MDKKRLIYLLLAVVLLGAILVVFLNVNNDSTVSTSNKNKKAYTSNNWDVDLSLKNKNPYGLYVFRELTIANGKFTEFNAYSDYHLLDSITQQGSSLMMYIGLNFLCTDTEIDQILKSVQYGNDFFLSAEKMPSYLMNILFNGEALTYYTKEKATHIINEKELDLYYFYENDTLTEIWDMFDPKELDSGTTALSTIFKRPTYIEIEYGLGKIYLHLNPVVFTNVQVLKTDGKKYLKEVLATLNQPKIQWLSFANLTPNIQSPSDGKFPKDQSLLSELFNHPAFRWGFVLAVLGMILYFIFRSKRSRPVIPALEDNKNTGFSYVDTLAGIYFNKDHGAQILKIMRRNFYSAVYAHFYVDLAKRENNKPIIALAKKSNIPLREVEQLIKLLEVSTKVSDTFLSNAYKIQRSFYFKSGIWNAEIKQRILEGPVKVYRQKEKAFALLGVSVFVIVLGFIFLSSSLGMGVLFWPLGVIGLVLGAKMLNVPAVKLTTEQLEIYPLLAKKYSISHDSIKFIQEKGHYLIIHRKKEHKVKLKMSHLDTQDRKVFHHLKQNFKPN